MKSNIKLALAALALSSSVQAATLVLNPSADATVNYRSGNVASTTNFGTAADLDVYYATVPIWAMSYVRFDLSSLAGATITDATLTFTSITNIGNPGFTNQTRNDFLTTTRFAVYGLLDVAGNTAQNWDETTITANSVRGDLSTTEIVSDTAATQLETTTRTVSFDNVGESVSGTGVGSKASVTGNSSSSLVSFLQGRLNAGASIGLTTFIVDSTDLTNGRGLAFGSRENTDPAVRPVLTLTYTAPIPEPSTWAAFAGLAGLAFAAGRRRRRTA